MSIIENLINQISESKLGGITKPLNFDLDDDTFAKLLEKQFRTDLQKDTFYMGNIGIPSGFDIEPFDAKPTEKVNGITSIDMSDFKIKDVYLGKQEMSQVFNKVDNKSSFSNFLVKQAADAYNVFGKEFITDINDFAQGLVKT